MKPSVIGCATTILVAAMTSSAAAQPPQSARGQPPFSAETAFRCEGDGARGIAGYQLSIDNCVVRARTWLTLEGDTARDEGSLRAEVEYEVDLTRMTSLASPFTNCDPNRLTLTPAKLLSKRVFVSNKGVTGRADDVPLWGADDATTLSLLVPQAQVRALTSALDTANDQCRNRGATTSGSPDLSNEDIAAMAKRSIVYLEIEGERRKSGKIATTNATGFIIGAGGFVVTAKHALRDVDGEPFYRIRRLIGVVGGGRTTSRQMRVEVIGEHPQQDAVLLKLEGAEPGLASVTVCKDTPRPGTRLIAHGFPHGTDFAQTPGTFSNDSGVAGLWQLTIDSTFGMSGGPVYDGSGRVRAIVKGGVPGDAAVSWFTPVRFIDDWLRQHDTLVRCQ